MRGTDRRRVTRREKAGEVLSGPEREGHLLVGMSCAGGRDRLAEYATMVGDLTRSGDPEGNAARRRVRGG
jgi:hypothetical protein